MGFLNTFKPKPDGLLKLSPGSFTLDREGRVIISTLPHSFPRELVHDIANRVMATFRSAGENQQSLTEFVVEFPALRLTARELRGGAIVFLAPHNLTSPRPVN